MKLFPMLGATILLGALSTNAWSRIGVSDGNNCILSTQNITVVSPCSNPETTCGTNEDGSLYCSIFGYSTPGSVEENERVGYIEASKGNDKPQGSAAQSDSEYRYDYGGAGIMAQVKTKSVDANHNTTRSNQHSGIAKPVDTTPDLNMHTCGTTKSSGTATPDLNMHCANLKPEDHGSTGGRADFQNSIEIRNISTGEVKRIEKGSKEWIAIETAMKEGDKIKWEYTPIDDH